jgi:hypothetical protein
MNKNFKELVTCVEVTGGYPDVPFHENWYPAISAALPGVSFAGWGNRYDGGTITYRGRKRFLDTDGIRQGLRMAYRLQRPLKKKEIFDLAGESLSGAAGRAAYFGLI